VDVAVESFANTLPGLAGFAVAGFGPEVSVAVEVAREALAENDATREVVKEIGKDICNELASGFEHTWSSSTNGFDGKR
jgi:hypothetical protein